MKATRVFGLVAICFISFYSLLGCTRQGPTSTMALSIPLDIHTRAQTGSLCAGAQSVQFVQANILVPGQATLIGTPLQNNGGNGIQPPYQITFPSVPNGVALTIQVLVVIQNADGTMGFEFGSTGTTAPQSDPVLVPLTQTGGATEQVQMAGRLMVGGVYPTGNMDMWFNPPTSTNMAPLLVQSTPIMAGWFNAMALNGAGNSFTYKLKETGQTLFNAINPDLPCGSDPLAGGCPFQVSGLQYRAMAKKPANWSVNNNNGTTCANQNGTTLYLMGWFGDTASQSALATNKVCYPSDVKEGVPGLYDSQSMSNPFDIDFTGETPAQAATTTYVGGGVSDTQANLYTGTSESCYSTVLSAGSALIMNHLLLTSNDNGFAGFNTPFQIMNPLGNWGQQYVTVTSSTSSTNSTVNIGVNTGVSVSYTPGSDTLSFTGSPTINVGDAVSGPGMALGATVSSVSVNSLSTPNTGTPTGPMNEAVAWNLLPGAAIFVSSGGLTYTLGSTTLNNVYTSGGPAPTVGMFVIGPAFPAGTTVTAVTGTGTYTVTTSQPATTTCATTCTLTFSGLAGMDIYAKFNFGASGAVVSSSNTASVINVPAGSPYYVGMPINANSYPNALGGYNLGSNLQVTAVGTHQITVNGPVSGLGSGLPIQFQVGSTNYSGTATYGSNTITGVTPTPTSVVSFPINVTSMNGPTFASSTTVTANTSSTLTLSAAAQGTVQFSAGDNTSGGGQNDCNQILSQGFHPIANQPTLPMNQGGGYPFDGNVIVGGSNVSNIVVGGSSINPGFVNPYWNYAVCPYVYALPAATAANPTPTVPVKTYIGSYQQGQANNGSGSSNNAPFGWAYSQTSQTFASATSWANLGVSSQKVNAVQPPSNSGVPQITTLQLNSTTSLVTGDQVLINIPASSGTGCPSNVGSQTTLLTRVLSVSGSSLTIPAGTWVDLVANGGQLGTITVGSAFCDLQVTRVAQFRNLTLSGTLALPSVYDYSVAAGGVLPIAVNGTMSFSTTIAVDGGGFQGGSPVGNYDAAGIGGMANSSSNSTGGGDGVPTPASHGGGGGAGATGSGSQSGDTSSPTPGGQSITGGGCCGVDVVLGSGGGAGGDSNSDGVGGNGGGAVYLAVNSLQVGNSVAAAITANGTSGAGTAFSSGGGGGGSISIQAGSVMIPSGSSLTLQANGGAVATGPGGVGGGGTVMLQSCTVSGTVNMTANAGVGNGVTGAGSNTTTAGQGSTSSQAAASGNNMNWCL